MSAAEQTIDASMAAAGSKATYAGAGFGFSGWLLSSEAGGLIGIVGGVGGLFLTWFYKRRQDRREQEEHDMRMAKGRAGQ